MVLGAATVGHRRPQAQVRAPVIAVLSARLPTRRPSGNEIDAVETFWDCEKDRIAPVQMTGELVRNASEGSFACALRRVAIPGRGWKVSETKQTQNPKVDGQ